MDESFKPYHVKLLEKELNKRKKANPRYSLRAFAQSIGVGSSSLSRILLNAQEVSLPMSEKILKNINFSEEEAILFIASISEDKRQRGFQLLSNALQKKKPKMDELPSPRALNPINPEWLLSNCPDLVYVINKKKQCLYVNVEGAKLHNRIPSELIGKTMSQVGVPADIARSIETAIDKVFTEKKSVKLEDYYPSEEGVLWFERIYFPVFGPGNEIQASPVI